MRNKKNPILQKDLIAAVASCSLMHLQQIDFLVFTRGSCYRRRCKPLRLGPLFGGITTGGLWSKSESAKNIIFFRVPIGALFAMKCFVSDVTGKHFQFKLNKSTAVFYINNMEGIKSSSLDSLSRECGLGAWLAKSRHFSVIGSFLGVCDNSFELSHPPFRAGQGIQHLEHLSFRGVGYSRGMRWVQRWVSLCCHEIHEACFCEQAPAA